MTSVRIFNDASGTLEERCSEAAIVYPYTVGAVILVLKGAEFTLAKLLDSFDPTKYAFEVRILGARVDVESVIRGLSANMELKASDDTTTEQIVREKGYQVMNRALVSARPAYDSALGGLE